MATWKVKRNRRITKKIELDRLINLVKEKTREIEFINSGTCPGYWFDEFQLYNKYDDKFAPPPTPRGSIELAQNRRMSDPPKYVPEIEHNIKINSKAVELSKPELGGCKKLDESSSASSGPQESSFASSAPRK